MCEYMFGVGRGSLTKKACRQIAKIAAQHDCSFGNPNIPGNGPQYWFAGPSLGFPFDQERTHAVWSDLEAAGLADASGLAGRCFKR